MLFITRTGKMSGADEETPTSPIQICDCGAPGLSTSVTTRAAFFACWCRALFGGLPSFQPPKRLSNTGISAAASVSPTTKSAAFAGRNHALCQATMSLREIARSEEHTSELQSLTNLVCRLLLEKKNK